MFLTRHDIVELCASRVPLVDPFDESLLRPSSYVLRLGNTFRRAVARDEVNVASQASLDENFSPPETAQTIVLRQREFLLASTVETVRMPPHLIGFISGISNAGRLGLMVHATSALINPGFGFENPSTLTLELASLNPSPLRLYAGMPLCHLACARLTSEVAESYDAVVRTFSGTTEPTPSRYATDFERYLGGSQGGS